MKHAWFALVISGFAVACSGSGSPGAAAPTGNGASGDGAGGDAATGMAGGPSAQAGASASGGAPGAEVVSGTPDAKGWVLVPPTDAHLFYNGRVDRANPAAYRFAYPAVSIRAHFSGTGLSLSLKDHGQGTPTSSNFYDVVIDGGMPTVLAVTADQTEYPLADGLPSGEHTVEVFKRIESAPGGSADAGLGEFMGFRVPAGTTLLPVAAHPHRIEAVGDSITCGYGVELSTMTPDNAHYSSQNENAHHSYVALAATLLDAEYQAVAYSGRGMSRNYADGGGLTLPDMYKLTLPDEPDGPAWDTTASVPDVVVINLGTNDFSTVGVDRDLFRTKYQAFLSDLRADYPNATVLATLGPMLSDYYPVGAAAWTNSQADVQAAVKARNDAGDANVSFLAFAPQTGPWGEDWHPTVAEQQTMANAVVAKVKAAKGW